MRVFRRSGRPGSLLPLAAVLALPLLPACAAGASDDESEASEVAYTADDAACFDAAKASGESSTDARARCLTTYASKVIDREIAKNEDARDRGLAAYKGKVRVPGETGCFTEDVSGSWSGAWQYDIDSKRDVGQLGVQIRAAVEMLKHFHRDLDGYPNHFFDTVEICPQGQVKQDLALRGSTLRVGMRTGWWGRFGVHPSNTLRDKWTRGEHLAGNAALEKLSGVRWSLLDPAGAPRTTVRRAVRGLVKRLGQSLGGLAGRSADETRAELTRLVRESAATGAVDDQGRNIRERALAALATMTASELTSFAARWKIALESPDAAIGTEEGTVAMRDVLEKRDVRVKVNQYGFVNVNNFKQISVDLDAFFPRGADFARYVEVEKTESTVEVNQYGFVNVQLNDVVTVRVQVLYAKTAQTATLDRVLGP